MEYAAKHGFHHFFASALPSAAGALPGAYNQPPAHFFVLLVQGV